MPRPLAAVALLAISLAAAPALADVPAPDAAQIRQAAEHFDAGAAAYKQGEYADAASHFEAADDAAPSPQALRQAIRARFAAGQKARAATLSAQALERYPSDEATVSLAKETIESAAPELHKVAVSCASPCVLAADTRTIPGQSNTRWIVYLNPGKVTLSASFFGNTGSVRRSIEAKAGGSSDIRFEPGEDQTAPPPTQGKPPAAAAPPAETAPPPPGSETPATPSEQKNAGGSGLPKAVFFTGLALTAGALGVTVWSGVDTLNNPGVDAVRAACAGQDETCSLYQDGLAAQTRTNVLIGVTAGTAALTAAIGLFFTNWRGSAPNKTGRALVPTLAISDKHTIVGASGAF